MTDTLSTPDRLPRRRSTLVKVVIALSIAGLLLVSIALLAHAVWRGKERAKADALVAAIVKSGQPMTIAELVDSPVPDDQNIVVLLQQARAVFVQDQDRYQRVNDLEVDDPNAFIPPLTDAEAQVLREASADNVKTLAILSGLSERHGIAWDNPPTTPVINWMLPELNYARSLANLLGDQAKLDAHDGNWLAAMEAVQDMMPIGDAVAQRSSLVGYLVAVGINALAAERLTEFAPTIDASDPAVRKAIERTIVELLDDDKIRAFTRRGLIGERIFTHDTFRSLANGTLSLGQVTGGGGTATGGSNLVGYISTPLLYRAEAVAMTYDTIAIDNCAAKTKPEFATATAEMKRLDAEVTSSNLDLFAKIMMPSLNRAMETGYRVQSDRHLAAVALAMRLFQQDHAGHRPATIDELVPGYLSEVPADALSRGKIRYDARRAIVWHVGQNEKDDNGDAKPMRPNAPPTRWNRMDAVVFLDPQPRPATQPAGK